MEDDEQVMGGVSKYTDKLANEICSRLGNGESLENICRDKHMPSANTVREWKRKNDDFLVNYSHAREDQGEYYGQKVQDIANRAIAGEIPPDVARVAMDGFKWTAARMNRAQYGDRLVTENINKNIDMTADGLSDEELLEIANKD